MRGFLPIVLCVMSVSAGSVCAQTKDIQPVRVSAGTVLTFYSQTRMNPATRNVLDELPKGTVLKVKILGSIDSNVDPDGLEFRGTLATPLSSGNEVIVHADAEVHGLLVLLRSRIHPEGFRYELLITSIGENGKFYDLTASLHPSFLDATDSQQRPALEGTESQKELAPNAPKTPGNKN